MKVSEKRKGRTGEGTRVRSEVYEDFYPGQEKALIKWDLVGSFPGKAARTGFRNSLKEKA